MSMWLATGRESGEFLFELVYMLISVLLRQYYLVIFLLTFVIPLLVIIFSYGSIWFVIYSSNKRTMSHRRRVDKPSTHQKRKSRLLTTIVILVLSYVVCWTPFHVFNLMVKDAHSNGLKNGVVCTHITNIYNT